MRTFTRSSPLRAAAVALALTAGLTLSSCTDPGAEAGTADDTAEVSSINKRGLEPADGTTEQPGGEAPLVRIGTLQDPVPGVVEVDGTSDSLTGAVRGGFSGGSDVTVEESFTGESRAFQRLCVGEVDIVDSSRPISPAEWEGCRAQGLDIVQFQVAADAVVLGIRNETDIGTDCLDTTEVRRIFESGSAVNNWSQVREGLNDVPLRTAGPDIDSGIFRFFGRYVLGAPEPSITSFRGDYQAHKDEDLTREFVVGSLTDQLDTRDLSLDAIRGDVGLFRENYYAVYEDLIRPFEVEVDDGDGQQNCIFPSPQTIVNGQYPLSRQLLLTVTTRSLKRPEVTEFLRYYLQQSQSVAADNAVIALPNTDIRSQLGWITDGPVPRFESVSGGPVQIQDAPVTAEQQVAEAPPVPRPAR